MKHTRGQVALVAAFGTTVRILRPAGFFQGDTMTPQQAEKTAQVRVRPNNFVMGYSPGTLLWVTPALARQLHAANCVEIIGLKDGKPLGDLSPEPPSKKSFDAPINGPSIGSASSNPPGPEKPLSASPAALASPQTSAPQLQMPKPPNAAASSPSTTRIRLRPRLTSSTSPTADGGSGTGKTRTSRRSRA